MLTSDEARRRNELMRLGYNARTSPELDILNRALHASMSRDELKRTIRHRREQGLPTGQLEAALAERASRNNAQVSHTIQQLVRRPGSPH